MNTKIHLALFLNILFLSPIFLLSNNATAQSTEISPRVMERMARSWSRMVVRVAPHNCNPDDPWYMAAITVTGIPFKDAKVIKPDGTSYVCKECRGCEGIVCQGASGKPVNVAKHCISDVDGDINF